MAREEFIIPGRRESFRSFWMFVLLRITPEIRTCKSHFTGHYFERKKCREKTLVERKSVIWAELKSISVSPSINISTIWTVCQTVDLEFRQVVFSLNSTLSEWRKLQVTYLTIRARESISAKQEQVKLAIWDWLLPHGQTSWFMHASKCCTKCKMYKAMMGRQYR